MILKSKWPFKKICPFGFLLILAGFPHFKSPLGFHCATIMHSLPTMLITESTRQFIRQEGGRRDYHPRARWENGHYISDLCTIHTSATKWGVVKTHIWVKRHHIVESETPVSPGGGLGEVSFQFHSRLLTRKARLRGGRVSIWVFVLHVPYNRSSGQCSSVGKGIMVRPGWESLTKVFQRQVSQSRCLENWE